MTERIYQEIGHRPRAALADARIEQGDLAARLNVSPSLVAAWVAGARRIQIEDLRRVAAVVDRPVIWLLGEEPIGVDDEFAHELHRLSPADRQRALANMRALRATAEQLGEQPASG